MRTWIMLVAVLLGFCLLPSCREKSQINNRIVVTAVGIDEDEEQGGCRVSIQAIEALKISGSLTDQNENATSIYEASGRSVASAMKTFVTQTGRNTYILQNRAVVMSLDLLKKTALPATLDYFLRNYESRPDVGLLISRGDPAEVLSVPSSSYTIPSEYLSTLIREGQRWGFSAKTTLLDAERSFSGMFDAFIPIVRVQGSGDEAEIVMDGTAVFREGVFAGELDEEETRGLLFATGDLERCSLVLESPKGEAVTVEVKNIHSSIGVQAQGDAAQFTLRVSCSAEVTEENDGDPLTEAAVPELERQLIERIEREIQAAVRRTVEDYGCDVFGFGRRVMKSEPGLIRGSEEEWPEKLKDCRFEVEIKAPIRGIGAETGAQPDRVS